MHSIIDSLPLVGPRTVTLRGGQSLQLLEGQIVLWISITPLSVIVPPAAAPRFPAILDTGFNYTLAISEVQLREWAGVDLSQLRPYGGPPESFPMMKGRRQGPREAAVWLYSNVRGERDALLPATPLWVYPQPGILVLPPDESPRIPLIGTRLIEQNSLQVVFDPIARPDDPQRCQLMVSIRSPHALPPKIAQP